MAHQAERKQVFLGFVMVEKSATAVVGIAGRI